MSPADLISGQHFKRNSDGQHVMICQVTDNQGQIQVTWLISGRGMGGSEKGESSAEQFLSDFTRLQS